LSKTNDRFFRFGGNGHCGYEIINRRSKQRVG
jgi:hypothetical protein